MKKIIISLAAILLFAVCASAQIEGRVTDAKGNGVPKVAITATGEDGEVAATTNSDDDGNYVFEDLDPGKYQITARGTAGFQPTVRDGIAVAEDETTTLNITLAAAIPPPVQSPPVKSAPPPSKPPVAADPVDAIIEKHINALGGREKLLSLKTIRKAYAINNGGAEGSGSITQSHLIGLREELNFGNSPLISVVSPASGYVRGLSGTVEPMPADDLKHAEIPLDVQSPLLDPQSKGTSVQLMGTENVDGVDNFKLRLTFKNGVVIFYFIDTKTYLLTSTTEQRRFGESDAEVEVGYYAYKKNADGYLFSYYTSVTVGQFSSTERYTQIDTNIAVDPSIFTVGSIPH